MIEVCEGMHVRETQRETLPRFLLCSSIRERKKKKTGNVLEGEKREEKEKLSLSLDASPPSVDSKPFSSLSKRFDNYHPPSPPSFFPFPSSSLLSLTHTRNGRRPQSPRLRRHPRQHRRLGRERRLDQVEELREPFDHLGRRGARVAARGLGRGRRRRGAGQPGPEGKGAASGFFFARVSRRSPTTTKMNGLCQKKNARLPFPTSPQVDAAVGLATKLYSSSAKELSDQVSKRGFAREGGARAGGGGVQSKKREREREREASEKRWVP